jgi:hypothetical protein
LKSGKTQTYTQTQSKRGKPVKLGLVRAGNHGNGFCCHVYWEQGVSWVECLPLIEFTYNNGFHSSIGMALFEALYGQRCRTSLCWYESGNSALLESEVVQETTEKVKMIQEKLIVSQSKQKSYRDKRRKDIEFQVGDHVFFGVNPVTGVGCNACFNYLIILMSFSIYLYDLCDS